MKRHRLSMIFSRSPVIYLILIATLTTLLICTGSLNSIDTSRRLQVTHSLWRNVPQISNEDLSSNDKALGVTGRDGKKYVTWGIGQSLVMLPADIISYKLTDGIKINEKTLDKIRAGLVTYLTFIPINVLSIIISFLFLQHLGFNKGQSLCGAMGLLFGTMFLAYAQSHQENSLMFLLTLSGYLLNLVWITSNSAFFLFLGACALGFNILVRVTAFIDIFSVSLFTGSILILQTKARNWDLAFLRNRLWKYLLLCIPPYLFFLGLDRLYHWMRFNSWTGTYTSIWGEQMKSLYPNLPESYPFSTPFQTGFLGALFSPERSIFLFNPLLVVTLILSVRYWKRLSYTVRALLLSASFLLFAYISAYAKWFLWAGASSWGPRYTTVPVQLLCLLSIPLLIQLYSSISGKIEKIFYNILVLLSVLIQISSVILDHNLELTQQQSILQQPVFIIGQRFINLMAIFTGNFDNWGLRPTNVSLIEAQKYITPIFMPWTTSGELPTELSNIFKIMWFIGLIILILLVAIFIRNTSDRNRSDDVYGSCSENFD